MRSYNQHSSSNFVKGIVSGKKKDDNFTEDSSIYGHGDENTNAANINSNRHDFEFDGLGNLSQDDRQHDVGDEDDEAYEEEEEV